MSHRPSPTAAMTSFAARTRASNSSREAVNLTAMTGNSPPDTTTTPHRIQHFCLHEVAEALGSVIDHVNAAALGAKQPSQGALRDGPRGRLRTLAATRSGPVSSPLLVHRGSPTDRRSPELLTNPPLPLSSGAVHGIGCPFRVDPAAPIRLPTPPSPLVESPKRARPGTEADRERRLLLSRRLSHMAGSLGYRRHCWSASLAAGSGSPRSDCPSRDEPAVRWMLEACRRA
jgi:hypothetical protein